MIDPGRGVPSCASVAAEPPRQLDVELAEVNVADALEELGGPGVGEGLGQLVAPGLVFGLQGPELGQGPRPHRFAAASVGPAAAPGPGRRRRGARASGAAVRRFVRPIELRAAGRPDPTKTPLVADALRGIARQHSGQPDAAPRQARALTFLQVLVPQRVVAQQRSPPSAGPPSISATATTSWSPSAARSPIRPGDVRTCGVWSAAARPRSAACTPRSHQNRGMRSSASASTRSTAGSPPPAPRPASRAAGRRTAAVSASPSSSPARGASTHAIQLAGGWKNPAQVVRYAASISTREGAVSKYLR